MTKQNALAQEYKINIDPSVFNEAFLPILDKIYNYVVLFGGAGSGKSTFTGQMLTLQTTTLEGRNVICMRKQATDCRDSCFAEIYNAIHQFGLQDIWQIRENPDMRMVNRINRNEIVFTGMDKVENIKSIKFKNGNATDFWYEEPTEETDVGVLRELDRRLRARGKKCRIILTFNPIYRTHFLYDYIYKELQGTDCFILQTTYKDNKFLDEEYKAKLERFRYTDPYSYKVYALGEWGTTGQTVFNANKVSDRLQKLMEIQQNKPVMRMEFAFEQDDKGNTLWDQPRSFHNPDGETLVYVLPDPRHPYVAAFDTAGEGSDYYACHVMDNITDEQVAVFHSPRNPDVCMPQILGLLRMYNNALVAPEVNFDSYPVEKLKEWHYTNIYQRESPKDDYAEGYAPKLGFRTTGANRQAILSNLVEWSNDHMDCINDVETLNEMLTFTRQAKKNKGIFWSAEAGAHDDLIMALAILLQAKEQQTTEQVAEIKKVEGYWTKGELNLAVQDNRMDEQAARDYMDRHRERFYGNTRRRSRYAR